MAGKKGKKIVYELVIDDEALKKLEKILKLLEEEEK